MSGSLEFADGRRVPVEDGMVIGRVAGCQVVLKDTKVSRRHARLIVDHGVVEVEDLGSSNGTELNGKKVGRKMVRDGDVLQIGKSRLVYREGALAPRAAEEAPSPEVIEFVDEVVEVRPLPPAKPPAAKPPAAKPPAAKAPAAKAPEAAPAKVAIPKTEPEPAAKDDDILEFDDLEFDDEVIEIRKPEPQPVKPQAPQQPAPKAAPAPEDVIEFVDETVEIRPRSETPAPQPVHDPFDEDFVTVRPRETVKPAAGAAPKAAEPRRDRGVLQYNKQKDSSGLLGDDMAQMGGGMKLLLVCLGLAAFAGLAYAAMVFARA